MTVEEAAIQQHCAQAVEAFFRRSYDIRDGQRVCKACDVAQLEAPDGHANGCWVAAGLRDALRVMEKS